MSKRAIALGLTLSVGLLVAIAPAFADGSNTTIDVGALPFGSGVGFTASAGDPGAATPGSASASGVPSAVASSSSSGPQVPTYVIDTPVLQAQANSFCISVSEQVTTDAGLAQAANAANEAKWLLLVGRFALCPGVNFGGNGAITLIAPAVIAAQFWQTHGEDLLAKPAPRIPPGWALTGKLAYLEAGGRASQQFDNPTPAGDLAITATGRIWVDWGDGAGLSGPYPDLGGPYPSGDITHTFDLTGAYPVRVVEQWSATWSLAGQSGDLVALRTEGDIPAFAVRQLESVRNR
jgi:hypothetical protein